MSSKYLRAARVAAIVAGAALAAAVAATPASAEIVGQLQCNIAGGAGNLIVSSRAVSCTYRSSAGPAQRYSGDIGRLGLDVGNLTSGQLVYDVVSIGVPVPGALQGNYVGAGFGVALGSGIGINALVGGSGNSFTLQPLSTTTSVGTNVNAGLSSLKLAFVGLEVPMMGRHRRHRRHMASRY